MAAAREFRDLKVYGRARELARIVFTLTTKFPREERYALIDQIRRSSRAVGAMIAEAWARRRYRNVFINKLDEALGEMVETRAWLDSASDTGYLQTDDYRRLDDEAQAVAAMLSRMIDRADDFCKNAPDTDYRSRVQEEEEEI